ncbi:MAG: S8 family serine peptidase, partial [Alphaproteobacteria bacterium]|nr:S8 family serine peptidase [Alphaproteobacteria bacterium]
MNTALSYGITGAGVNVAVIDSGVQESHPELAGVMLPGGREYFTTAAGAPNTFDADIFFGHGTHVAGTIAARRNGTGMQGVAPGARILGLAVIGSGNPVDAAINYAATYSNAGSGIKVINGSYGLDYLLGGIATPFDLAGADAATVSEGNAYMNAVARGIVVVLAAGNEGFGHAAMPAMLPLIAPANDAAAAAAQIYVNRPAGTDFSSLKSNFVAVVAVDSSRNIASFSNRCGLAKTWCIAAPGVNIKSTVDPLVLAADFDADGYETYSGTSQAAPHVTGAIALLMQMFPNLTPQQVVQLLFVTADDLGAAGVDDVYGNGLVNLTRAMGPVGTTSFKTAGGKVAMAASGVTAGSAAGDALTRAFAGKRIAVYDDLDRAFFVDLGQFARAAKSTFNVDLAFDRFARMADRAQVQLGESMTLSFRVRDASVLDDRDAAFRARAEQDGRPDGTKVKAKFSEMTVERRLGDGASVTFGLNADINRFVGHFARNEDLADMRVGTAFASPFLSFVQDGYAAGSAARLGAAASFRVAAFSGERADGFGTARSDGFVSELTVGSGRLSLGLQSGLLDERNRVLGGYGTGAFSLGDSAATAFVGALADLRMSDSLSLLASYQAGWTRAVGSGSSLLRASGLIRSDSFSLGLVGRGLLRRDDWLSLSLSQPLRVASGKADVDMALGYDSAGNPVSARFTADLAPSGRELEVELAHGFAWGAATRVSAGIMLRIEPDHVRSAPAEGLAL